MPTATNEHLPLFTEYTLEELERRTTYEIETLVRYRMGRLPLNDTFKKRIAFQLGRKVTELFALASTEGEPDQEEKDGDDE